MSILVRRAIPADALVLSQVAEQTFRQTFEKDNKASDMELHCTEHFGRDVQYRELVDPNIVTLIAETEDGIAGFAQVKLDARQSAVHADDCSELNRFYVHHAFHGKGAAHNLMASVKSVVEATDSTHLWLGVWEHNPRAIAFYHKYGFEVVGEHMFKLGTDPQRDLIMAMCV